MKSSKVSIKTRSTPASLSFKGQATKHTTVKWSMISQRVKIYKSAAHNSMRNQLIALSTLVDVFVFCESWSSLIFLMSCSINNANLEVMFLLFH